MGGRRAPDAVGLPPRRRGLLTDPAAKRAARKAAKESSAAFGRLHERVKVLGAAHPGIDFVFLSLSMTDKKPAADWGACTGAALRLAAVLTSQATLTWVAPTGGPSFVTDKPFAGQFLELVKQIMDQHERGMPVTAFASLDNENARPRRRQLLSSQRVARADDSGGTEACEDDAAAGCGPAVPDGGPLAPQP